MPNVRATGVTTNTRDYDGCVIVEHFSVVGNGTHGMSMSFYDVNRKVWRMVTSPDSGRTWIKQGDAATYGVTQRHRQRYRFVTRWDTPTIPCR